MSMLSRRIASAIAKGSRPRTSTKRSNARTSRARIGERSSGPRRVAEDLEARPVVALEQSRREEGGGVTVEVGGKVPDAQAARREHAPARSGSTLARPAAHVCAHLRCSARVDGSARNANGESAGVACAHRVAIARTRSSRSRQSARRPRRNVSCASAGPCAGSRRSTCSYGRRSADGIGQPVLEQVGELERAAAPTSDARERRFQRRARLVRRADADLDLRLQPGVAGLARCEARGARRGVESLEHPPLRLQRQRENEPCLRVRGVRREELSARALPPPHAVPMPCIRSRGWQRISDEWGSSCAAFSNTSTAARRCPIASSTRPRFDHASAMPPSIATDARRRSSASPSLPRLVERNARIMQRRGVARIGARIASYAGQRFGQLALLVQGRRVPRFRSVRSCASDPERKRDARGSAGAGAERSTAPVSRQSATRSCMERTKFGASAACVARLGRPDARASERPRSGL